MKSAVLFLAVLCVHGLVLAEPPVREGSGAADSTRRTAELSSGRIHIICSSHQDIAWMDSPWKCVEQRDVQVITPALALMREHPDYRYGMESMMNLMEYLERHPDRKDEIYRLTKEGRFEWGATYNQPYESLLSGEQLVRETYFGRKWIRKNFPGCDALVAWNPDVPGRSLQSQQILAKAGIKYLMISRQKKSLFRWNSPDGSGVIAFTPGHYYTTSLILDKPDSLAAPLVGDAIREWSNYYGDRNIPPHFPFLYSQDALGPRYFDSLIKSWNGKAAVEGFPLMKHSTAEEFFASLGAEASALDTIVGERPNVWLYIHGPTHHWAISSKRDAGVLLPAAETFSTIDAVLDGSYARYPQDELSRAWAASIFDDHGWGGNQGQVTDQLFRSKLDTASAIGREELNRAVGHIASRVKLRAARGIPVVVFNALSWRRSDPVVCTIPSTSPACSVTDANGTLVPCQILPAEPGQLPAEQKIMFVARDVPSVGYKTYYVIPGSKRAPASSAQVRASSQSLENSFYRIRLVPGGIRSIVDKQLNRELLNSTKFLGTELFTMQSVGFGAGEFSRTQQPSMEGFDKLSLHGTPWQMAESGPVYTAFVLEQRLSSCTLRQKLIVYHEVKRIDAEVSILGWNGTPYREFRMALPVNMDRGEVTYEVPMGTVTIGKDEMPGAAGYAYGQTDYSQPCSEARPREVQDFVSASDAQLGVTMSSSVAVFDFMDPTTDPLASPMIQPILLASRKSCHSLGNWYLQEGDHHYRFSIFSHAPGWKNGYRQAIQANNPLVPVVNPSRGQEPRLPEEQSFFSIDAPNVMLSTMKKCEDDNSIVVRCYDMEGRDTEAGLHPFFAVGRAELTNIIEEDEKPVPSAGGSVAIRLGHHAIETVKLIPAVPMREHAEAPRIERDAKALVTMTSGTPGARIYYTLDGSVPDTASALYGAPVEATGPCTINAIAFHPSMAESRVTRRWLDLFEVAEPMIVTASDDAVEGSASVAMSTATDGAEIHYTLDGTAPDQKAPLYRAPIDLTQRTTLRARAYRPGCAPSPEVMKDVVVVPKGAGLAYRYYEGSGWQKLPDFASLVPAGSGIVADVTLRQVKKREDQWGAAFSGYIDIRQTGVYTFFLTSDDGARLSIDGSMIVDNDGSHSAMEARGNAALQAGAHEVRLEYFDDSDDETLVLEYQGPGISRRHVPPDVLFREKPAR